MKAKNSGFTLIELMFTILVIGVLLGLAGPSFRDFIRNSRLTSSANDLLAGINLARTEAIKRRTVATLCSSANPDAVTPACRAADTDNFNGWFVFVDDQDPDDDVGTDGNGTWDVGEEILRRRAVLPASVGVTAKSDGGFVSYSNMGFLRTVGGTPSVTRVFICDIRGNARVSGDLSAVRAVTVSATGRAGVGRNFDEVEALLDDADLACP